MKHPWHDWTISEVCFLDLPRAVFLQDIKTLDFQKEFLMGSVGVSLAGGSSCLPCLRWCDIQQQADIRSAKSRNSNIFGKIQLKPGETISRLFSCLKVSPCDPDQKNTPVTRGPLTKYSWWSIFESGAHSLRVTNLKPAEYRIYRLNKGC